MAHNIKKIGLVNWILLLAAVIVMLLISRYTASVAALMGTFLAGFGLLVALMSYCQMCLEAREQLEKLELEELSKTRGGVSIFAASADDTFPARRSREQFERFFVPAISVVLLGIEVAAAWFGWQISGKGLPLLPERATLAMALLGLLGLILFLMGKYSSGLARLQNVRLLRPGAAYLLLTAYACFAVTATFGSVLAGAVHADLYVARALCVVTGLVAVETLIGLVLELYRVRVKGKESRLLYESRLVGLLGQPEAIITTAAHALDYQFGFKVSETWFYKFLEKALAWLVLAQLAILVASTCFIVIEPGQQALLERCGKPVAGSEVIGPGFHLKWPWPIEQVYRYNTEQIQRFIVGAAPDPLKTIQWTVSHAKEENFLVANHEVDFLTDTNAAAGTNQAGHRAPPVSLLAVSIPVQYQITNLVQWAYNNDNPSNLLQMLATRQVVQFLAGVDLADLMSVGRGPAAEKLRDAIQAQSDAWQLGANITFVGLQDIHPPTSVAKEYEGVINARESREVKILDAQAHATQTNAQARGESYRRLAEAEANKEASITNATARANLFANQGLAYAAAPGNVSEGIYEHRAYLDGLIRGYTNANKKVIMATASGTNQIFEFNLEDKIRDLGNSLTIPTENK